MGNPFKSQHAPKAEHPLMGGVQYEYRFANGYGASVVRHEYSYGGPAGLWEVAVLGPDGRLTYETTVTDDVLGYLSDGDVRKALDDIAALVAP